MNIVLTPELLLSAYTQGLFPMAHSADSPYVHFICPEMRGQLPIKNLHIRTSLMRSLKKKPFEIRIDTAFNAVIKSCALPRRDSSDTWINDQIVTTYTKLYEQGHAHSVECWDEDGLAGGLYGLKIGAAFFGESMFSAKRDASKIALIHLCARLYCGGFTVLDTQFINNHLLQFGAYEISHESYMEQLEPALYKQADWTLKDLTQDEILSRYLAQR